MASSEDDGAKPSISNIADAGDGNYEVTLRCSHGGDAQGLSQQLKSGKLRWKDLSCESTADSLRLEMIKKMAPPPRVKFVIEMGEDPAEPEDPEASSLYFQSYGDVEVHELMLRDRPRMEAYHAAIQKLKHLIVGKAVLDVGTGTGVLAMMAAKAGRKRRLTHLSNTRFSRTNTPGPGSNRCSRGVCSGGEQRSASCTAACGGKQTWRYSQTDSWKGGGCAAA
eukprot:1142236-Rhodomonas_salina.2